MNTGQQIFKNIHWGWDGQEGKDGGKSNFNRVKRSF